MMIRAQVHQENSTSRLVVTIGSWEVSNNGSHSILFLRYHTYGEKCGQQFHFQSLTQTVSSLLGILVWLCIAGNTSQPAMRWICITRPGGTHLNCVRLVTRTESFSTTPGLRKKEYHFALKLILIAAKHHK